MSFKEKINSSTLPVHVAVIMDGNGRWARQRGRPRTFGHKEGVESVKQTVEAAAELGIQYLTLYAFSTENWNRPRIEINTLMSLLVSTINKETATLMKNEIKLAVIGDLKSLPSSIYKELQEAIHKTRNNKRMTMVVALSYSSRWEITDAVKRIAKDVEKGIISSERVSEILISSYLCTSGIPDPELLIRTSGEYRISNFLLWQIAYAELYFSSKLWPDFRKEDFFEAIVNFQTRERRFGMISEQITTTNDH